MKAISLSSVKMKRMEDMKLYTMSGTIKNNSWTYSFNEEYFSSSNERFASRDEAIEYVKKNNEGHSYAWVGRIEPITAKFITDRIKLFNVEDFNEQMAEEAGGDEDYIAEDYNAKELSELEDLIANFIVEKMNTSISYSLQDVDEINL